LIYIETCNKYKAGAGISKLQEIPAPACKVLLCACHISNS